MTRVAFRLAFAAGKPPPEITCGGCGARELQSGLAVSRDAINMTVGRMASRYPSSIPVNRARCARAASSS